MPLRTPLVLGALAAGTALLLTGCSSTSGEAATAAEDDVIRFATLPTSDDPTAATPIEELKTLLEEETGYTVEITDVPSYSAVIEAIRAGHEDITPDTVVAFADPASSSGFFMPTHMLHEAGMTADEDFEVLFSGGHDRSFIALEQGQADVACTSTIFPSMAGKGDPMFPFEKGETRSIGESISMPIAISILGNQDMSAEKRAALLEALPAVFSAENKEALGLYMEAIPEGVEPILEPGRDVFQPFVDIAAVADVDISDLE